MDFVHETNDADTIPENLFWLTDILDADPISVLTYGSREYVAAFSFSHDDPDVTTPLRGGFLVRDTVQGTRWLEFLGDNQQFLVSTTTQDILADPQLEQEISFALNEYEGGLAMHEANPLDFYNELLSDIGIRLVGMCEKVEADAMARDMDNTYCAEKDDSDSATMAATTYYVNRYDVPSGTANTFAYYSLPDSERDFLNVHRISVGEDELWNITRMQFTEDGQVVRLNGSADVADVALRGIEITGYNTAFFGKDTLFGCNEILRLLCDPGGNILPMEYRF